MKKLIILIFGLAFLTSACSLYHVDSEEVSTGQVHPSKKSAENITYLDEINRPYEIVGFVTVNTERRQSLQDVIERMKKEAANLGGDALTNMTTNASGTWRKVPAQKLMKNAYIRANFTATVVAYTNGDKQSANDPDNTLPRKEEIIFQSEGPASVNTAKDQAKIAPFPDKDLTAEKNSEFIAPYKEIEDFEGSADRIDEDIRAIEELINKEDFRQ